MGRAATFAAAVACLGVAQGFVASPASAHSRPAGPPGFTYAASEGQHFTIRGYADVAYGVDGKFTARPTAPDASPATTPRSATRRSTSTSTASRSR